MASINNSEFNSYLSQAKNIFGQIESYNNGSNSASSYMNSIFSGGSAIADIASNNDQQKAKGIQSLIKTATSLIKKLASNEAKAAADETKNNAKKAHQITKKQKKAEANLNKQIGKISEQVEAQSTVVTSATETLTKQSEELQKKQEEIDAIVKQIQEKQQELAKASTPEEQTQLLEEIQGLSAGITNIVTSINDIQNSIAEASSQVEGAVIEIETAKGNSVEIQQNGQMQIQEIAKEGADEIKNNVASNVKGIKNEVTGQVAQAAAEAASSNVFTAASAAKLYKTAVDQNMAGTTRLTGAVSNLNTVMQGIGALNNHTTILANFETAIGGALSDFSGYVGDWNSILEPTITSIGTITGEGGIQSFNEELANSVGQDLETLASTDKQNESEVENEESTNNTSSSVLLTPNVKFEKVEIEKK